MGLSSFRSRGSFRRCRPVRPRLFRIGDRCGSGNNAALRRHARLGLSALDKLRAGMRELSRPEHRTQVGPDTGVTKRRERDGDYRGNDHDRHIAMPACGIEAATASSATANEAERSIVLEL